MTCRVGEGSDGAHASPRPLSDQFNGRRVDPDDSHGLRRGMRKVKAALMRGEEVDASQV